MSLPVGASAGVASLIEGLSGIARRPRTAPREGRLVLEVDRRRVTASILANPGFDGHSYSIDLREERVAAPSVDTLRRDLPGLVRVLDRLVEQRHGLLVLAGPGTSETEVGLGSLLSLLGEALPRRIALRRTCPEGAGRVLPESGEEIPLATRIDRAVAKNPDLLIAMELGRAADARSALALSRDRVVIASVFAADAFEAVERISRLVRRILRVRAFEAAARAIPILAEWIDEERSQPAGPVRGMRSLRNRRLRLVRERRPVVLGISAVGDAAVHTNPLYGRGCTLAFVHAWLLRQALREHPGDAEARALAFHEATERELGPWYVAAREQDRDARRVADAWRRGEDPDAKARSDQPVDPRAFMRSVLRDGLLPALRTDAVVLRTFARIFNLLAAPDALVTNPDVLQRILAAWRERDSREAPAPPGPGRDEMVELLERVA